MKKKRYYSPSTLGFYVQGFKDSARPEDCVEITTTLYNSLAGQNVTFDEDTQLPKLHEPSPAEVLSREKGALKSKRDTDLQGVTVTHNSKAWSFSTVDMSRFESKISRNRDFLWKADDGSHNTLTPAQAENIAKKVDDVMTQIFFDAEIAVAELEA